VSDAAFDDAARVLARELFCVSAGIRVRGAIRVALERDGGEGDDRTRRKPLFEAVILRLPFSQSESPAVVMNDYGDMIWIVE